MRVVAIHNLPRGGARRRLAEQVRHLDHALSEVCLSTAEPVTDDPVIIPYAPRAPRLPPAARPPARYTDLAELARAWRAAADAVRRARPDVVFANPCQFLNGPIGLVRLDCPSVYFCDEPHLPASDPATRASRNPATRLLYAPLQEARRRLDRAATLRATALATNSAFTAGRIAAIYGRAAAVLPMGVPDSFTPAAVPEPPRHVLSVGALLPDKGHDLVLEAVALTQARRPVTIIAPRADAAAADELERRARELGVTLRLLIGVGDDDVLAAFRGALATVYLAREEPFGLVSIEAQRCGSPVIVTAAGGLPETIQDGLTGWAVPRTPQAAAARLDELEDPARRAAMAGAAAEHAAGATWGASADALDGLLRAVALQTSSSDG